jgi:hypothetical protein
VRKGKQLAFIITVSIFAVGLVSSNSLAFAHIRNAPTTNIIMPTIALETPLTGSILDPIRMKPIPLIK